MNIYRLKYERKNDLIQDLQDKGVVDEDANYINGTQVVVYLGETLPFQI